MRAISFRAGGLFFHALKKSVASFSLLVVSAVPMAFLGPVSLCIAADERNPFGVTDVPNPDGDDVQAFAQKINLLGDKKDDNAPQWSEKATKGNAGILDGEWFCRWSSGGGAFTSWYCGIATVRTVKDRVYILYKDETGTFLIDTLRKGNRLIGRYLCVVGETSDSTPWVALIVDNERIDGSWRGGRWDLRRQLIPAVVEQAKEPELKEGRPK